MKFSLVLLSMALVLGACSGEGNANKGKASSGKGSQGKGRVQRTLNVEGYVTELSRSKKEFQTMATLVPMNQVSLSVATSGRLIALNAKDGATVQKGDLLAKIDDSELKAQLKQAESNLLLSKQKFDRTKRLHDQNGATVADMESAEASLKSAEASVELIKAQIEKTEVRAPFSGRLGFVDVSVGAWLTAGSSIANLSEVGKLKAKFSLPQRYASVVKVGDALLLRDEERNVEMQGMVSALDATISESSRTRQILVSVDNSDDGFIAGSYASVKVSLSSGQDSSFTVPAEAIILDRDGAYVFVCDKGKAKVRYVQTGLRTPFSVEVRSGLNVNDTVIVSGIVSLREGIDVKIRELRHSINYEVN